MQMPQNVSLMYVYTHLPILTDTISISGEAHWLINLTVILGTTVIYSLFSSTVDVIH